MARNNSRGKAAYTLVDLSDLPADVRQEIMEDALAGGGEYGLRVVEEVHNGAARAQIFGYYRDVKKADGTFFTRKNDAGGEVEIGNDETKWNAAKAEFGITSSDEDDAAVSAEAGNDPRTEAALRQAAEQKAAAEADAVRTAEEAAVTAVLEGENIGVPANSPNRQQPNNNIADSTAQVSHDRPANRAKGK